MTNTKTMTKTMTIFVTRQLRVTLDSIRNSCDVCRMCCKFSVNIRKYATKCLEMTFTAGENLQHTIIAQIDTELTVNVYKAFGAEAQTMCE